MAAHDVFRQGASADLAVASTGGASASTAAFGAQTYALRLAALGTASSTAGVRYVVGDTPTAGSTSTLLPANWYEIVKCTPGQKVAAIGNDGSTYTLNVVQLTD